MRQAPRHNAKVDLNQKEIIHALEKIGCTVEVIGRPVDLLCGYRKKNFLIEVKTKTGKPTPAQELFFETWKGQFRTVRTVDEALDLVTRAYTR
jgi:hypothetical protein